MYVYTVRGGPASCVADRMDCSIGGEVPGASVRSHL